MSDIWSAFRIPRPGRLQSDAPSVGPTGQVPPDAVHVAPEHEPSPEQLVSARQRALAREMAMHPQAPIYPRPNQLYDNLRSRDAWRYVVENTSHGTFTPASGTTVTAVTYDQTSSPALLRLDQFPRGTHAYPVLIGFFYAPVAVSGTGELSWQFQPATGGIPVPLGEYNLSQASVQSQFQIVLDAPITDPGSNAAGNLIVIGNTVATPAAVFWRISWGYAYLLPEPAFNGYEALSMGGERRAAVANGALQRSER